jgi:hypothetical protein
VLCLGAAYACRRLWTRSLPVVSAVAFMTGLVMLCGKVYQPQYDVWIIPFLALTCVPWRAIVSFLAVDGVLFAMHVARGSITSTGFWYPMQFGFVVCRVVVIAVLLLVWVDRWPFGGKPSRRNSGRGRPLWAGSTFQLRSTMFTRHGNCPELPLPRVTASLWAPRI